MSVSVSVRMRGCVTCTRAASVREKTVKPMVRMCNSYEDEVVKGAIGVKRRWTEDQEEIHPHYKYRWGQANNQKQH